MVGILVLGGLGAVAIPIEEKNHQDRVSVSFSEPLIETENDYINLNIKEANSYLYEDGKPVLPTYSETYTYPFGTRIKSVTCVLSDFNEQTLGMTIKPTSRPRTTNEMLNNKLIEEEAIDYGTEPYPGEYYSYDLGCGRQRDGLKVFVNIQVNPIKFYPQENKIKWANNAKIVIEYEPPEEPIVFDDEYRFVIIGPTEFGDELAPLVSHKQGRGITTKFVTLTDIYNGVYFPDEGRDDQEQIKYFIKEAIENWGTSYVLLVGGSAKCPVRLTNIYISGNEEEYNCVTDLYYADIYNETGAFCDWDSNQNDVFGEFNWGTGHEYDDVDLYPDVFIGRLACINGNEVTRCVNKIKDYENSAAYSQDWFKDFVGIGGDTWVDDDQEIPEGEYIIEEALEIMEDFDSDLVFDTNGKLGDWSPPYGTGHISNAINKGCGFLHWSGHGHLDRWASHRWKGSEGVWIPTLLQLYPASFVRGLSNDDELPIAIIGACLVGKFNVDPDCFTWSHMMSSGGGAVAAMSATDSLYSTDGTACITRLAGLIELSCFRAYVDEGALTFGEMWAWALQLYIEKRNMKLSNTYKYDYLTVEEWQAFGDPTLALGPESQPPEKPNRPTGPNEGVPDTEYTFYGTATDPDYDKIYILFDWGDGTDSGWIGPEDSGTQFSSTHTWTRTDAFNVKVRAKDIRGDQSEWSEPLVIDIPRSKNVKSKLFQDIFDYLEDIFPILKITLRLLIQ